MNNTGKILVTGGAGYIGSHTVRELLKAGYQNITVIDDLSTGYRHNVPSQIDFIEGDFSDRTLLNKAFSEEIETVIHFAASKSAPESVSSPVKYYQNNIAKSLTLLEKCLEAGVKNFVFSSSAAVYGDVEGFPITEDFPTRPASPYGWSKLMFEQMLEDVSKAHNLRHVSLRYFNAGGADPEGQLGNNHQKGEDLISVLMRTAASGKEFSILGTDYDTEDGSCIRDLIHVTDLAAAHVKALEYLSRGGQSAILNLGSEKGFSVKEIAELAKKITGSDFTIKEGPRRPGDVVVSIASSKKAKDLLDWQRQYSDIETLLQTAWQWQKKSNQ